MLERNPLLKQLREVENIRCAPPLAANPQRIIVKACTSCRSPANREHPLPQAGSCRLHDDLDRVEDAAIDEALDERRYKRHGGCEAARDP